MEELLSDLNKFHVKTEEELFADQFSKLSAGSNVNKTTKNQPNHYTTHKMFGKDTSHSTTTTPPLKQENININTNAISNNNTWQNQFGINNDDTVVGWNQTQTQKANEDEGWGNLPDVNTSVNPNHAFGMNSILSAEILNLGKANVNQQHVFGSEYNSKFDKRGFTTTTDDNFRSSN